MRWYEGDIAQAVSMSKSKNAVFVVYVEGKDEKSTNLTSLINDNDVSTTLESEKFVAIKVEAGSISHNQFAAIYKSVPVPSIFFIGKSGKPIDIIVESSSANDLSIKINSVIEKHTGLSPVSSHTNSQTSISSLSEFSLNNSQQSTSTKPAENFIKNEQQSDASVEVVENSEKPSNVVSENGICHIVTDTQEISTSATNIEPSVKTETEEFLTNEKTELSAEEKVERAKELLEMKREAKKKEEEENERLKEIERRKSGQDVQKLRRWQQDQELKNLMEERQRAKNEEKADRERILAQIAQDKADRAAKFGTSTSTSPQVQQPEVIQRPSGSAGANSNRARLQFKLPDGSSRMQNFESSDSLLVVRNFVIENLELPFKNFTLSTTFPRREFSSDDLDTTLKDLELVPNAVILILPSTSTSAVEPSQGGGFLSIIWFLISPILGIFGYIRGLIFGQPEDTTVHPTPDRNKRTNTDVQDDNQQAPKRKATETTIVRRQGNIHRLSDRTDSDDDNNTWNGNSTQQM